MLIVLGRGDNMAQLQLIETANNCKVCSKCKKFVSFNNFGKAAHHKDGLKSHCNSCEAKWHAENYKKNSAKINARHRAWKAANPEYANQRQRKDMLANPDKYRNWRLKRTFGISLDEYNKMFADQNGRCAICSRHQSEVKQTLCVDHNHKTGKIRKLLCGQCNHAIGLFREDISAIKNAIKYLKDSVG